MTIRITAIRLSGGASHQHITHLWWTNPSDRTTGDNTRAEIVSWIEVHHGQAYVEDRLGRRAEVRVVTPQYAAKYLRTYADGIATDNLLSLPRK